MRPARLSTPRSPPSTTPRSGVPSPSSTWSSRSRSSGGAVHVSIFLTVAGCPMKDRLTQDIRGAVGAVAGVTDVSVDARRHVRRAARDAQGEAARRAGDAGDPVRPAGVADPDLRGGLRQGRRGQVQRHGEPGRRDGRRGPEGRRRRRRRLRLLGAAHARRRPAADPRRRHDPAADGARREGHLDRHVRARQPAGGVARADAAPGAGAVPRRTSSGATSTSCCSTCRPAPATSRSAPRSCCRGRRSSW